ncbi:MAG TPA: hypothetical protein VK034_14730 [Enhygromyxa sp.]|nr:hypothetical protein [Enhygromyxa sp.]
MGAAAVGLGGLLAGAVAFGSPPRFDDLFIRDLEFEDQGSSLSVEAEVRNLDRRRDVFVALTATAELDLVCINPGGREVPGQKPRDIEVDVEGFARFSDRQIDRNGRLEFDVETDEVGRRIPGAPDCPNRNWTERVRRVRFLDARLTVRQGRDRTTVLCTFDPPTRDGEVRDRNVDCFTL